MSYIVFKIYFILNTKQPQKSNRISTQPTREIVFVYAFHFFSR